MSTYTTPQYTKSPLGLLALPLCLLILSLSNFSSTVAAAQPDLTKSTDNLSNLNPYPGDVVTASLTIMNQSCTGGSASAGAFHVGFYWSTTSTFSGVSPFYEAPVSGCAANGTVSISPTITISSTTTPGTYYLGYKIDDLNEVAECNENNNGIFYWTVTVRSPALPDFVVTSITLSPSSPHPGQAITAYVTVKNQGTASGSGGWLDVWKNQPSTQACGVTGDSYQSVGTLAAGASSTFTFSGLTAPTASGSYTFRAFVDSGCTTTESNEGNNQTTLGYTVAQPAQPDLTKSTDNLSNLNPYPGDVVTASVTIMNQSCTGGSATAGAFHVGFYWSTTSTFSGVSPFYEAPVSGCAANGTVSISPTITISSTTTPGTYYLGYKIDDLNEVAECNENNNGIFYWTVTVRSPALPDFVVTSISLSPSSPQPGQAFTAYVTVKNQGTATGSGGWLDVWKNQPSTQACGATGDSHQSVGTLVAGASTTLTFSGLTAPAASGIYTFRAFVDSGCTTAESNEGNNQTTLLYNIPQPDLAKSTDSLNNLNPHPGDTVTASITVMNQSCSGGSVSAGAFHVGFYWSTTSTFSGVSPFYEAPVTGCAANGNVSISPGITISSTTTPGTYYLGYKIDDLNEVAECNENNNGIFYWTVNVQSAALPDFVVTSISLSPPSPQPGQAFTAYVTVKNQGTVSGNGGWLDVWANRPSAPACGTAGNTWTSVGTLTAGQSATYTLNLTAPAAAGSYTFRAFVDSFCQTAESSEANNQTTLGYNVVAPTQLPDFVVTSISLSPSSPQPSQAVTAYVTVKNQGSGAGNGGWLDVWANQPSAPACGTDGNTWASIGTLAAGASRTFTFSMTAPAAAGTYIFRAFADSYCQTAESNEANNQGTSTYTVVQPAQQPDFVVTAISLSPASPQPGQTFTGYVTVKNQGAGAGDGGWLDVWANQASAPVCGTSGNAWASVGALSPGQTKTLGLSLTAPASAGTYTFRAFVDSFCQTTESNEGNNQSTLAYTVAAPTPLPDFLVTAISFSPAQPIGGQPFTAYVTVKNQGAGPGDAHWLDVWVNQPTAQSCGASGDQYQSVGTLTAGQSATKTFNLTAPASGAPWTFRAFVDSGCQTAESNDANNQTTASYGVNPVQYPDFVITGVSISPTDVKPGATFTAYVTVKNQGAGSGDGGWLDVWANKSTAASCGDSGDAYQQVGLLAAGASKTLTLALTAGPAGLNTLLCFVDSSCQTTESNEANNQFSYTYAPAVGVWSFEVAPFSGINLTAQNWATLSTQFRRAANFLYDATDGQVRLGTITINPGAWFADIRITDNGGAYSTPFDWFDWNGFVVLNYQDEWHYNYGTLVHELGHYKFGLGDEYTSQRGKQPCADSQYERHCGPTTGRSHCLMEIQFYEVDIYLCLNLDSLTRGASEFCTKDGPNSAHSPTDGLGNPSSNVQQDEHGKSCWEVIKDWNSSINMPASDPLPGPCSTAANDNQPLGENAGVAPFVTIIGP